MAAGYVFRHAMKVRSALWTGRRFYCGMITATAGRLLASLSDGRNYF